MTDKTPRLPNPVVVANPELIPVDVQNDEPLRVRTEQDKVAASRTTASDKAIAEAKVGADVARNQANVNASILRTEDQRRISGIWERTQQIIALAVVIDTLLVVSALVVVPSLIAASGREVPPNAATAAIAGMLFLTGVANLVIGFYFGRTNHSKVGGSTGEGVSER